MFMRSLLLSFASILFGVAGACAQDCASLASLKLPDATITTAEMVTGGTVTPPYGEPQTNLPAFCRVIGVLHPSADSDIRFELWMPEGGWNHRFLGVGNGGFAGSIAYRQLAGNVRRGFATAGSDAGHQADAEDASWAYRHPEKIVDFGYRAVHVTTSLAKTLIARYYGSAAKKSYFDSCSDGGREALMEAQRFPEDYDGILAGAPANNWTRLLTNGLALNQAMLRNPGGYISSLKLPAITAAVLAQCDAQDGLKDGILNDPRACHFDPEVLLCKGADALDCLTAPQVATLRAIYAGAQNSSGQQIFPGLMPGDEAGAWKAWVVGNAPSVSAYAQNYFRYMVYTDPTWNALTANIDQALAETQARTARAVNATDPDLSRFADRGGKLILYHGWNDPAISPLNTIAYYQSIRTGSGSSGPAKVAALYMVPGMEHCTGGPGASAFGQLGISSAVKDDSFPIFAALEDWVEKGQAPGEIIAAKYSAPHKIEMTRPLCPYPSFPHYKKTGSPNEASSFDCVAPGKPPE